MKNPLRPKGGLLAGRSSVYSPQTMAARYGTLAESVVNGGMNTTNDSADIENKYLVDAKAVRVYFDKTSRRWGVVPYGTTKPNSSSVIHFYAVKQVDGSYVLLRFTPTTIHKNPSSWTAITGTLNAGSRYNITTAFGRVVFTNGVDDVQLISTDFTTFAQLGNAPSYKYCTAFADRIVAANLTDSGSENPIQLGWSANGDITEWDPVTDISAGFTDLKETPGDLSDFITGVFGFSSVLLITREQSLWVATKQAVASEPFIPRAAIPKIGFGCPYATAVIPGGVIGADHRTRKVYAYTLGDMPVAISDRVERDIFRAITDPEEVFGSYNHALQRYTLGIPLAASGITRLWTFDMRTQSWVYDERAGIASVNDIEGIGDELYIDELVGMIDDLVGNIDDLKASTGIATTRIFGYTDGSLRQEDPDATDDDGTAFTSVLTSKTWTLPETDEHISKVRFEVFCRKQSTFELYISKDDGLNWTLKRVDTVTTINEPVVIIWTGNFRCRRFTFKIENSDGDWDLISYEVRVYQAGDSRTE